MGLFRWTLNIRATSNRLAGAGTTQRLFTPYFTGYLQAYKYVPTATPLSTARTIIVSRNESTNQEVFKFKPSKSTGFWRYPSIPMQGATGLPVSTGGGRMPIPLVDDRLRVIVPAGSSKNLVSGRLHFYIDGVMDMMRGSSYQIGSTL